MMTPAKAKPFWEWFQAHHARIETGIKAAGGADLDLERIHSEVEELIGELHANLQAVDERAFPLVGLTENEAMELVITADGDVEAFDDIKALVAAAPGVPGWNIVALKPRLPIEQFREMGMHIAGHDIQSSEFSYALRMNNGKADLFLAFDDRLELEEEELFAAIASFLDQLLGEEVAATVIDSVDCGPHSDVPVSAKLKPLWELQAELDRSVRH